MRLELALVVGILLFCSWCAYIVARMSSSTNEDGQTPSTLTAPTTASNYQAASPDKQYRSINQTGSLAPILIDHLPLRAVSERQPAEANFSANSVQQQQRQQLRQFGASEPVPTRQTFASHYQWAPYANQQPQAHQPGPLYSQPQAPVQFQNNGNGHWQAHALPTGNLASVQEEELQDDDERKLEDDSSDGAGRAQDSGADSGELDYGPGAESSQRLAETEDMDPDQGEGAASSAVPTEEEADEGEEELERDLPPVQSELEEISKRRSFDELESDERERDRDGHLVQSSRKHLINGKPVARTLGRLSGGRAGQRLRRKTLRPPAQQRIGRREDGKNHSRLMSASSGRKQTRLPALAAQEPEEVTDELDEDQEEDDESGSPSASESDFEGMVREIDHEDKLQRAAAKAVAPLPPPPPLPSQTVDAAATAAEANVGLISVSSDQLDRLGPVSIGAAAPESRPQPATVSSGQFFANVNATTSALERRQDQDDGRPQAAGSTRSAADQKNNNATNIDRDSSNRTSARQAKSDAARDSHEHRVQETLLAQQWDDDSDSLPEDEAAEAAAREVEELRRDEDQERVGNIVERDDEARQLEKLSRKLLKQSVRVPEELERRKRHVPGTGVGGGGGDRSEGRGLTTSSMGTGGNGGSDNSGGHEVTRVNNDERHREAQPENGHSMPVPANASGQAERLIAAPSTGPAGNRPGLIDLIDSGSRPMVGRNPGGVSLGDSTGSITLSGGRSVEDAASDIVSGSEDMHVAVLAQAPPEPAQANGSSLLLMNQPVVQMPTQFQAAGGPLGGHRAWPGQGSGAHLASGSHKVTAKKKSGRHNRKNLVKKKRSELLESKKKGAKAYASKQRKRMKKGNMNKKRRKFEKESLASRKHFEGLSKGKKLGRGHKSEGGKKGSAYLKDKGYKKKGFKRSYHKLETGDHKTYFDEFRDKDQKKKWKDFDDKHKYSQRKKWAGYDSKHHNRNKLHHSKGNASKLGKWRERSELEHMRQANKYKGSKRLAASEGSLSKSARLKRKKRKHKGH